MWKRKIWSRILSELSSSLSEASSCGTCPFKFTFGIFTKQTSVSRILSTYILRMGLPLWLSGKESVSSSRATGDLGLIPGSGRSPGGGHNNPLQYSYLENPMDRGAWRATVNGVAKSWTRLKWLATHILWIPVYIILSKKTAFSLKFCPYDLFLWFGIGLHF